LIDLRWQRVLARDASADGQFWYSVATTRVYCNPSCASRPANPKNVSIHDTLEAARATGFRPCKRCRPESPSRAAENAALVATACRLIEESGEAPSLSQLAEAVGLSPAYFHRIFKSVTGITPKNYLAAHRGARVRSELDKQQPVTQAIYDSGYNSSGQFYQNSTALLGMTPRSYKRKGQGEVLRFAIGQSSLGAVLVASSQKGVACILMGDDPDALARQLQDRFRNAQLVDGDAQYQALVAQVVGLIEAPNRGLDLPLDVRGTAFQQQVWQALREIPPGQTLSYADVASKIGAPKATRAVANACAANSLAVAIPCHRVVGSHGSLSGYRWGVERKRALLDLENAP
jgi:AraC family transcriptional regulator, regulatory protein of adaptative response / methylated-DNA-[protein]-cysteine methyltransferase